MKSGSTDITDHQQTEGALKESDRMLKDIINSLPDASFVINNNKQVLMWNRAMEELTGVGAKDMLGKTDYEYSMPFYGQKRPLLIDLVSEEPQLIENYYPGFTKHGDSITAEVFLPDLKGVGTYLWGIAKPLYNAQGNVIGALESLRTTTKSKQMVEALRIREEQFSTIFRLSPMLISLSTLADGRYVEANELWFKTAEYTREEAIGHTATELNIWTNPEDRQRMAKTVTEGGVIRNQEYSFQAKSGRIYSLLFTAEVIEISGVPHIVTLALDITDRKQAMQEKEQLQAQLLQAQKLESVGRLAGGVAHDFNNMLSVIIGNTEMAMDRVDPFEPLHTALQDTLNAAKRSADLTRQLLAFARKQTVNPKVLDLNDTVIGMLKMLQRLIGEDINLVWTPGRDLWRVRIDPSQVDQLLANLTVNARDAMNKAGKIIIETYNIIYDETYCTAHPECIPGQYVMLAVSDDGVGMEKEILSNIFEPFFTTKKEGQGTGLGLATVYGVVKQNGGFVNVVSEPGNGTTFRIYLPRYSAKSLDAAADPVKVKMQNGTETILIVEDEEAVLKLSKEMLEMLGYKVLAARETDQAIRFAEEFTGSIDLLLTDVVMPGMNGKELSDRIRSFKPGLRCLYMSGYTADVIARQGILEKGLHFLPKPFSLKELSAKVRETLG